MTVTDAMKKAKNAKFATEKEVDAALIRLDAKKRTWVETTAATRVQMLRQTRENLMRDGLEWAKAAVKARGFSSHSNYDDLLGEEYLASICGQIKNINFYLNTLEPMALQESRNETVTVPGPYMGITQSVDDKATVCHVFPASAMDAVLWVGLYGELWVDKVEEGAEPVQGSRATDKSFGGAVSLVLGAGNVNSIAGGDILFKLFNEQEVVLLKWNPVNDYSDAYMLAAYKPFFDAGVVEAVRGDGKLGTYILAHPIIANWHMTGAAHTYDQIVWGPGNAQTIAKNKRQGKKSCTKPATAELGCVSPLLIVPGDWTDVELEHVAAQIAGTVTNNNSYNCVAGKVLIIDGQWDLKDKFIGCVEAALARVPTRNPYYPGSKDRYSHLQSAYQERFEPIDQPSQDKAHLQVGRVKGLLNSEVDSDEPALSYEAWSPFYAELIMDKTDGTAGDFLQQAVETCNTKLWGTLSCSVYIDPRTETAHKHELEMAIANLTYGSIGVNVWPAFVFALVCCSWGAAPVHIAEDIQSGQGFVHNSLFFENVHKSVLRAPFVMPLRIKLPYHTTFKNLLAYAQAYAAYEAYGGVWNLGRFLMYNVLG